MFKTKSQVITSVYKGIKWLFKEVVLTYARVVPFAVRMQRRG